ncbi:nucleotidyltransferase [Stenotrophomonas maltophilia]|uniref:nucleotidyltransferase domain-containing protein n=1 Tax=Stenotrophomonas maltophilia TaxID=40324 RepID=UPI001F2E2CE1|nr:nucleotidyltransferase [Stenotrophomonas maltophilia]MCF3490792.1 nucleotidyltransferase [Stenotrophomonas maltophilia]MCF3511922.1 nucleotidyltransferase [Stenotrophomonas maltophilia]
MNILTEVPDPRAAGWEHVLFKAADDISLSEALYQKINDRYDTLQDALRATNHPLLKSAHVFPQGSIRLRTAITPCGTSDELGTVDADAVIWLEHAGDASAADMLGAIEERFSESSRVQAPIEQLRRGIRIVYADENPGFHIDVTPARNIATNFNECGHGRLVVPDRKLKDWKASAPIDYCAWLEEVAELSLPVLSVEARAMDSASQEDLPSYSDYISRNVLRAAIKLLKRNRDTWAQQNTDLCADRPISAVITTLAALAYQSIAKDSNHRFLRPIDALLEVVERMPDFIGGSSGNWLVLNPVEPSENFAEKWNRPEGANGRRTFDKWHAQATNAFSLGLREHASMESFREEVSSAFGVGRNFVKDAVNEIPATFDLPGASVGTTRSKQLLEAFSGAAVAGRESQANIQPIKRLG